LESKTVMGISDTIKSENRELERTVNSLKEELMQAQTTLETLKRTKTSLETELYNYKERELTAQA
jgi:predicted  nucleic acid-binding Zn-ribbon protein